MERSQHAHDMLHLEERISKTIGLLGRYIVRDRISPEDVRRIRPYRFIRPKRLNYRIPVDMLGYGALSAGLAYSLEKGVPFRDMLNKMEEEETTYAGFG